MTAILQEQEAPIQNKTNLKLVSNLSLETRVYLAYKHRTANRRHLLKEIIRANIEVDKQLTAKTKYISTKAVNVAEAVMNKILYDKNDVILGHKYLTKITRCLPSQNSNILKDLDNLYGIQYHRAIFINGNFYEHHYTFKLHPSIVQELKDNGLTNSEFYPQKIVGPYTNNKKAFNKSNRSSDLNLFQNSNVKKDTEISVSEEIVQNSIKKERPDDTMKPTSVSEWQVLATKKINKITKRRKSTNAELKAKRVKASKKGFLGKAMHLKDMQEYLTPEMCSELRHHSRRDFTNNAISEIMENVAISAKGCEAFFMHIKGFVGYMTEVLKYEMRDSVQCSDLDFYIKKTKTEAEIVELKTHSEQQEFLGNFEDLAISSPCPENQLKAKWACTLPTNQIYNLLLSFVRMSKVDTVLEIVLSQQVELTKHSKSLVLQAAQAVGEFMEVEKLEFVV